MVKDFFSGAKGVKRIVLIAVAAVLVGVIIAVNCVVNYFAPLLHGFFAGSLGGNTDSEEAKNALGTADELVGEIAEESMVLLKNDNGFLPLAQNKKVNLFGWASTDKGFLQIGGGSGGAPIDDSNPYQAPQKPKSPNSTARRSPLWARAPRVLPARVTLQN